MPIVDDGGGGGGGKNCQKLADVICEQSLGSMALHLNICTMYSVQYTMYIHARCLCSSIVGWCHEMYCSIAYCDIGIMQLYNYTTGIDSIVSFSYYSLSLVYTNTQCKIVTLKLYYFYTIHFFKF